MPRMIPTCPERPSRPTGGYAELAYEISLLTPMFGGGVEAGEPDPLMPFRATAIRGQLQFWWRATAGATCADVADLLAKHSAVWGNTGKGSPVKVIVDRTQAVALRPCGTYGRNQGGRWEIRWDPCLTDQGIPYALFPFAGKPPRGNQGTPAEWPAKFLPSGRFTLRVICPNHLREGVQTAVRAWVNFGGMGARTRRGCGSVYCDALAPKNIAEAAGLVNTLLPNPPHGMPEWPTLGGPLLVGNNESDAITAWASAIGALQKFRQGVGFARNPGQDGRPGRSRWPEPETIRNITSRRMARHQRMEDIPNDALPRAELGLPIIFHFKDGDPADTTLYPLVGGEKKCDRMASPLIIKALGLASGNAVPIVLRLRTPQLKKVRLEDERRTPLRHSADLRGERLACYRKSPMAGTRSGSALDAFIDFIRDGDVWGVPR